MSRLVLTRGDCDMVKVKPIDKVVKKWSDRASVAEDDYRFGVENPKQPWSKAAEAAYDTWVKAIQAAIANKSFVGGVRRAGDEKWRKKALEVGARRFAEGVRAATDDYAARMSEVLRVLEGITLPPRGPKGDPANINRVATIAKTLHDWAQARKKA